jgi:CheY-like chemotaxis protein/anti-sigma regulatory factor (Ser/Thr protein kinase)
MTTAARILLAEDEEIMAAVIEQTLSEEGFEVVFAGDGQSAWDLVKQGNTRIELFLLDWEMPRMDGMQLLRKLKSEPTLAAIPVVMQTAFNDPASIQAGLDAGAYYYLTKPFLPRVLISVVRAALEQYRDFVRMRESVRQAERPFALMETGVFHFRTLDEAVMLADFFAHTCPDPEDAVLGLRELLINAVEHGNLGISYAEKSHLMHDGRWREEIEHRLSRPEHASKRVEVRFRRSAETIEFTIQDQGRGFDWTRYLDFDPARVFDLNGRGIAMARAKSFDALAYSGNGNVVTATVARKRPLIDF